MNYMDKIIELRKQVLQLKYDHFMNETLFSMEWWILLAASVLVLVVWWRLIDKKRLVEISLVGFIAGLFVVSIDDFGLEMSWWAYPLQIYEIVEHIDEIEIILTTAAYVLLYQYFEPWSKYTVALLISSAFAAFVGVPLAVGLNLYRLIHWNYFYSFLVFICMGILIKLIVSKVYSIQKHAHSKP